MKREIENITLSMEYIVYHLSEYADDTKKLKETIQEYLDKAWVLVEKYEATTPEALHIRDLGRIVNMILDSHNNIVF
jgi:hypothetical protein